MEQGATCHAPEVLDAINPETRASMAQVFVTAPSRVPAIVACAQDAARAWGDLPFGSRAAALARLREVVARRAHEIAETIACGMGKPLIEALLFEVKRVLETLDDCIAHASDDLSDEPIAALVTLPALLGRYGALLQARTPRAVVCVIAPVSAPFERAMTPAVLALAAGNAVIVKPSSSAPLVGVLIERLFDEALLDFPGLAQVVHGAGALGRLVARSAGVDAVIFAGSTPVGRQLQAELAALQRPALFELGGADPVIVCDDANLERAANATVFGRFSNNGQACGAVKRVYVQRTVADAFIHKVMHKVRALKSGPYTNPFCELGPLANGRDLEHLRAVLQDALDHNAQLLTGGFPAHVTGHDHGERRSAARQGWYWPPAVLTNVDHSMRVMKEPLFGPILPIQAFEDDREAILLANDTAYGFDACIFSGDPARAEHIATGLKAGCAVVNDVFVHGARPVPQGGAAHNDGHNDREPQWFPYSAAKLHAIERAMTLPDRGET
jgi:acyl-CoA reductase-like NAD-dependent aldehyde dehydrogenase